MLRHNQLTSNDNDNDTSHEYNNHNDNRSNTNVILIVIVIVTTKVITLIIVIAIPIVCYSIVKAQRVDANWRAMRGDAEGAQQLLSSTCSEAHTCHILPPFEIDWGLFSAVFAGSEGKSLIHRIG